MGNDVYRIVAKDLNVSGIHNPKENTVGVREGPGEWTIKETDVPGVYTYVSLLLTFAFYETWLVAAPSDAQTYTHTLKKMGIGWVTMLKVPCH